MRQTFAKLRFALTASAAAGCLVAASSAVAADISAQRLKNADAEPQNWLLPFGNYSSWSHSSLKLIDRSNVGNLKVAFMIGIGGTNPSSVGGATPGQRARPVVADGFMYVHNAWSQVLKIDVSKGNQAQIAWMNDPAVAAAESKPGSVALLGNGVFNATRNDMRLVKIDAESGATVFDVPFRGPDNAKAAERATAGSLAVNNQIITGAAGPAMRGWLGALDADTGKLKWRFYTIPGPGEPGHETWQDNHNAYLTGGAGVWTTPSYDAATNLVIFGTGEAQPWADQSFHPGDNLYALSNVAVNADTGKLAWYFQEVPQETWDYDTVSTKVLYDIVVNGQTRKTMGTFSRNGFYYNVDRNNGQFLFASPYRDVNWTAGIDPKTGKPVEYNPNQAIQTYANNKTLQVGKPDSGQNVCPAIASPTWWPAAYDPDRQMAWIQTTDLCLNQKIDQRVDPTRTDLAGNPGMWGGGNFWTFTNTKPNGAGLLVGVDAKNGQKKQELVTQWPMLSGLLGTAGGLLFAGHPDGKVAAYDKDTLKEVWSFNIGTPISAPPIAYSVGGKEYIAVVAGGVKGGGAVGQPAGPILGAYQQASMIVVFGL